MLSRLLSHRYAKPALAGLVVLVVAALVTMFALGDDGDDEVETVATTTTTTVPTTTTTTEPPPTAPLTGEAVTDTEEQGKLFRPALAVKIDNAPKARPQHGLTDADVVYEPRVEGGVTRLLVVFHMGDSDPVGPIRSFRTSDVNIISALNRPLFAWHGSNLIALEVLQAAKANGLIYDVGINAASGVYYRERSRPGPHNSFSNTSALFGLAPEDSGPPPPFFEFLGPDDDPEGGEPARTISVSYGGGSGAVPIQWDWAPQREVWVRGQAGTPHVDDSGEQVAVENVVVQFTPYVNTNQIDPSGAPVPEAQTVGEGEVWLFTRGQRFVGTWRKTSPTAVTEYLLPDGTPMEFSPGQTWVQLPPAGNASFG